MKVRNIQNNNSNLGVISKVRKEKLIPNRPSGVADSGKTTHNKKGNGFLKNWI